MTAIKELSGKEAETGSEEPAKVTGLGGQLQPQSQTGNSGFQSYFGTREGEERKGGSIL